MSKAKFFSRKRKSDGTEFLFKVENGKTTCVRVKTNKSKTMYTGLGIEFMPPKLGVRKCHGDPCLSPAVLFIRGLLERHGIEKTPKQVWYNFKFFKDNNPPFLTYDEEYDQWKGVGCCEACRYSDENGDECSCECADHDDDPRWDCRGGGGGGSPGPGDTAGEHDYEEEHMDDY